MNDHDNMAGQLATMAKVLACPTWCDQKGCDECAGGRMHEATLARRAEHTLVDLVSWVGFDGEVREPKAGLWVKGNTIDDSVGDTKMTAAELREVASMMLEAADRMDEVLAPGAAL